ncbi:MAG: UDP-N-acetylmuramoyl-tripeptide--D-alanyl-D-alanine ligase [Synergistaceae bacterium]|jgi:UDP-N-acetylmuramoyl-tripeptide--D-alanyl-D-alanine ligase|nr:UDP-N-acetylmuramoyl-tripeptide--D-alanyl-D-alanine ligase [Synergistaceae bacterium]
MTPVRRVLLGLLTYVVCFETVMRGLLARPAMAVAFFVCYAVTSTCEHHMFQLNSYKTTEHLRWMRRNLGVYVRLHFCAVMAPLFVILYKVGLPGQYAGSLFVMQIFINWPQKAKKPLVYTGRVKRMFFTNAVLTLSVFFLSFFITPRQQTLALALWLLSTPFVMLISNAINSPVESYINRRYIDDARRILRDMPNLIVIGVTGSYGKTSVKYFLHRLLSSKYNVLMTPGNYNTTLGVVRAIRENLRPLHEVFICEMGARNVGDIKEICGLVRPRYGVITSIGPQHLESFGSIENAASAKFELADALPDDGTLFLNGGDLNIEEHLEKWQRANSGIKIVSYSNSDDSCRYFARELEVSNAGSSFTAALKGGERKFETKLVGAHNVTNIMAAVAVADFLGVGAGEMAMDVRRLEAVPHRLQLIDRGDIIIIDDAYNSNASGARAALDVLAMFEGFKILVTPGMIELGASQDEFNRVFGAQAAHVCDFVILVGKKGTRGILAGLKDMAFPDEKICVTGGIDQAFERIGVLRVSGGFGVLRKKIILIENDLPDNY